MAGFGRLPTRFIIIFLTFFVRCFIESMQFNLYFCLKHMTHLGRKTTLSYCESIAKNDNTTGEVPQFDYGPKVKWSRRHYLQMANMNSIGYIIISAFAGIIVDFIGPMYILVYALITGATLNFVRVCIAENWKSIVVVEFFMGMNVGLVFPSIMLLAARWAPPYERGIFIISATGKPFGIALVGMEATVIGKYIGWRGVFYFNSGRAILLSVVVFFLVSNSPDSHRCITDKELRYIQTSQKGRVTLTKTVPPYAKILKSKAFWTVTILNTGISWGIKLQFTTVNQYLHRFIGLTDTEATFLKFIPFIGLIGSGMLSGLLADFVRKKNLIEDTRMVKICTVFSHLIPGIFLLVMPIAYCDASVVFILLSIGATFIGSAVIVQRTAIDIAPNYAATIFGFMECLSKFFYIMSFEIDNIVLKFNRGIIGWTIVFLIGGYGLITTGAIFLFFGTAGCQSWNRKRADRQIVPNLDVNKGESK